MKYKVKVLHLAALDAKAIKATLSLLSKPFAKKFISDLKKRFTMLESNPRLFEEYQDRPPYRKIPIFDYIVLYTVHDEEKEVRIFRIYYGKMDIPKHLNLPH